MPVQSTEPASEPEPAPEPMPEAEPEPAPAPAPAPAAAGQPDAAAVRAVWSEVRAKVRERSRTVEVMLSGATVRAIENNRLILVHASAPLAKRLVEARNADVIRDALREVFGVDWTVDCEVGTAEPAAPVQRAAATREPSKPAGGPRFSRPSQGNAQPSRPRPSNDAVDDIPPPDYPDYPDDPGPPPDEPEPPTPENVTPEDEEEMIAQAAEPGAESVRRDPVEMAIELLEDKLGAKRIE